MPRTRANAYVDSAATASWNATIPLNAARGARIEKKSMAGRYIQPDSGSPANGVPLKRCGFQPGTAKSRRRSPRNVYQGKKKVKRSKRVSQESKARRFHATRTVIPARTTRARLSPRREDGDMRPGGCCGASVRTGAAVVTS